MQLQVLPFPPGMVGGSGRAHPGPIQHRMRAGYDLPQWTRLAAHLTTTIQYCQGPHTSFGDSTAPPPTSSRVAPLSALFRPTPPAEVIAAADAFGEGDIWGIGGWASVHALFPDAHDVWWFSLKGTLEDKPAVFRSDKHDGQRIIGCLETLAQIALLLMRQTVQGLQGRAVGLEQRDDSTTAEKKRPSTNYVLQRTPCTSTSG